MEPNYNLYYFFLFFWVSKITFMYELCVCVCYPLVKASGFVLNIQTYERNVPLASAYLNWVKE